METEISVLFVDDDEIDRIAFERFVKRERLPYRCAMATSIADAKEILKKGHHFNIAILDHNLSDGSSHDLAPDLRGFPFIVVTGAGNEDVAVQSMKEGASDYIVKGEEQQHLKLLPMVIKNVLHRWQLQQHSDFFSVISHELRTPLSIQKEGISNLMEGMAGPLSESQQKIVRIVQESQEKLEFMIGNILTITDLNKMDGQAAFREVQPLPVLTQLLQASDQTARKRGISLVANLPSSLSPVFSDEDLVRQVLLQLMDNALHFAKTEVGVSAEPRNIDGENCLCIGVTDDGPGISPAHQRLIFEPFSQANRPAGGAGYQGIGLGLAICRLIMDRLKGTIQVKSAPGRGSTFYVLLPQFQKT